MELKIEYLPVGSLKAYDRNARKHEDYDIEAIKNSIGTFEFNDPIAIWGKDNEIVCGHGRLLAAKRLGMDKVPCIRLDHLTDEERRAYALAHNKTAENSSWDSHNLDLELEDIDIDMSDFGFDIQEDEGYSTEFELKDGDRDPIQNMTFTFSDDEAETIKTAIAQMKKTATYENYENPLNENGNGKALYLVVREWQAQRK